MPIDPQVAGPAFDDVGWDHDVEARWHAAGPPEGALPGRVVRVDHGHAKVTTPVGMLHLRTAARARDVAVGDWAVVDVAEALVLEVLERTSELVRTGADNSSQVLAANVDLVLIAAGVDRGLNLRKIERFLLLAWESGATPVIVSTKADLVDDAVLQERSDRIAAVAADVPHVAVSVQTGVGIEVVVGLLAGGTTGVLVGESGAGKSSLINTLVGFDVQGVADVREFDAKGRHTTTSRELFLVEGGGVVIDTPGIRTIGVAASDDAIAATFPDIAELAESCKYRDCGHDQEPGCAVQDSAASGALDPDRLGHWLRLRAEIASEARRRDPKRRREDRQFGRMARQVQRIKRQGR